MFEYNLDKQATKHWQVLRANINKYGQPDPDYVSLCTIGNNILLLDPERNQIWRLGINMSPGVMLQGLLPGIGTGGKQPGMGFMRLGAES